MSNFSGVTFAEQKVTPSDDAVVRRAILPDGVLTGCAVSYSGSTLTMASGSLMVCGRQINHTAAENWAVVDATSGYARLVLTVDLTLSASKDSFEQVTTAVEYASALTGFSALTQNDINAAGTKYQVALCVVSLATGGISGIVSRLASVVGRYASANGTSSALSLPSGAFIQVTLDVWKIRSDDAFTFGEGGIVMPKAGTVMICASVYFDSPSPTNPASVGPYVKKNGVEISGQMTYSDMPTTSSLSPFITEVSIGDIITLHARSGGSGGSCIPNGGATGLTVIYL